MMNENVVKVDFKKKPSSSQESPPMPVKAHSFFTLQIPIMGKMPEVCADQLMEKFKGKTTSELLDYVESFSNGDTLVLVTAKPFIRG